MLGAPPLAVSGDRRHAAADERVPRNLQQRQLSLRQAVQALPLRHVLAPPRAQRPPRERERARVAEDSRRVGRPAQRALAPRRVGHLRDGQDVVPLAEHDLRA